MKELKENLIDADYVFLKSQNITVYIPHFKVTQLPENFKKSLEIVDSILEKARKNWDIKDENAISNAHFEKKEDKLEFYYSLIIPLKTALQKRRKERYFQYLKGEPVTPREKRLFEFIEGKFKEGKEVNFDRLPVFYDLEKENPKAPPKMPGYVKDDEE